VTITASIPKNTLPRNARENSPYSAQPILSFRHFVTNTLADFTHCLDQTTSKYLERVKLEIFLTNQKTKVRRHSIENILEHLRLINHNGKIHTCLMIQ